MVCVDVDMDDGMPMELSTFVSMEVDGETGKGISRVNFVLVVASGAKFIMTSFPGMINPNGGDTAGAAETGCSISILGYLTVL